jgi:hypothetical protein
MLNLTYMKTGFFSMVTVVLLITVISCTSKTEKVPEANTDEQQKPTAGSPVITKEMENILGEWTLVKVLRDDNGNHKIDEEEEKTAIPNTGYMKLNADGTCKFQTVMDGTYEIVTEADGRKRLAIHEMSGTQYPISLYIVSVSENELVINTVAGGSGFEVYQRS